jgi:phosphoribosylaminoimidazole-succinocarboxamide synthase
MRAYLAGVTSTSIWTQYKDGRRDFGSFRLPDGMRKNEPLPEPIFTPTTKEESHDRNVTPQEAVALGIISKDLVERVEDLSRQLFARGREMARARGFLLVDTKYEFGLDRDGNLLLIDEIHSPDSSRWWMAKTYEARMRAGQEPDSFDKEFLRLWFVEHCDPYKDAVLPQAPPELVQELASRYVRFFEQMTGEAIAPRTEPVVARIRRNLAPYAIG